MEKQPYVVVVGGLNLDIAGLCGHVYREKDSNIGTVALSAGGVGHNIAQNIAKLGVPVELVTVFGDDHFGRILEEECEKDGIGLHYAQKVPGGKSCTYLYITDSTGEMMSAINAMALIDCVTPEFWRSARRSSTVRRFASSTQTSVRQAFNGWPRTAPFRCTPTRSPRSSCRA